MNDKTTIKLIKIIMGDKSISDSDKIDAVKKLTDSTPFYYQPTNPIPCPDQYPIYPRFPWDGQPTWTTDGTEEILCQAPDLTIESGKDLITDQWFKFSTCNLEPATHQ